MPQTTLIESATNRTCVLHVARISNKERCWRWFIGEVSHGIFLQHWHQSIVLFWFDLFSAGEGTLYSERNPRRTPRPSLPQPRYTLTEIDKKRCQALTAKNMTYSLLVGETTAMMWNATGHGWNPLEKSCAACVWETSSSVDFGLHFDFIGEQGVVTSTLRVIVAH